MHDISTIGLQDLRKSLNNTAKVSTDLISLVMKYAGTRSTGILHVRFDVRSYGLLYSGMIVESLETDKRISLRTTAPVLGPTWQFETLQKLIVKKLLVR